MPTRERDASSSMQAPDAELELNLGDLFGAPAAAADTLHYGDLALRVIAKEGAGQVTDLPLRFMRAGNANALLADHVFSSAFALAEYIEAGHADGISSVVELGAASGLPSLLLAARAEGPKLVVLTDYPGPEIVGVTASNVEANRSRYRADCRVEARGHRWGDDTADVLCVNMRTVFADRGRALSSQGFDCVILSDLVWITSGHSGLEQDVRALLARRQSSRALVFSGRYTPQAVLQSFIDRLEAAGLKTSAIDLGDLLGPTWTGTRHVRGLAMEAGDDIGDLLLRRRQAVVAFEARWRDLQ